MSYKRKPNYHFQDENSTGINKVPEGRIVVIDSFLSELTIFKLKDISGLTSATTISQAVNNSNLVSISTGYGVNVKNISSGTDAHVNDLLVCSTAGSSLASGTAYTVVLPSTAPNGGIIRIMDGSGNAQNRPILIDRNGNNLNLDSVDLICDVNYFDIKLVFDSSINNWAIGGK